MPPEILAAEVPIIIQQCTVSTVIGWIMVGVIGSSIFCVYIIWRSHQT